MASYPDLLALPHISTDQEAPDVIFLDAVGTIIQVKGSVGEIYQHFARKFGVECTIPEINQAFYQQFKAAPPIEFSGISAAELPIHEYAWWREINRQTFMSLGKFHDFSDFDVFFAELYPFFATAEAWEIYPDTCAALQQWQALGIPLEIISNFDTRLYQVLSALDLQKYFSRVTISTVVGVAKPNPTIFQAALAGRSSSRAWHIGDSEKEDYQGAIQSGLQAFWLERS